MNFRAGKERFLHCTHFLRRNVVYQNKWCFRTSISCRSVLIHIYLHSNWLYNQSEQTAVWPSLWQLTLKADVLRKKWQVNMKKYSDLGREENKRNMRGRYRRRGGLKILGMSLVLSLHCNSSKPQREREYKRFVLTYILRTAASVHERNTSSEIRQKVVVL